MNKFLKAIFVIQEVSNLNREPKLGNGYSTACKFNAFNPLSYIVLLIIFLAILVWDGVGGLIEQLSEQNPFEWD